MEKANKQHKVLRHLKFTRLCAWLLSFFAIFPLRQSFNYGEALSKSLLYFESQRSGRLPYNQRVVWRYHSGLADGLEQGVKSQSITITSISFYSYQLEHIVFLQGSFLLSPFWYWMQCVSYIYVHAFHFGNLICSDIYTCCQVDLVGGYYDAGDNVKFGLPMAFTITMLSWSVIEYSEQISGAGEYEHALEAIKWGTDYFIKAHTHPHVLWAEVSSSSI